MADPEAEASNQPEQAADETSEQTADESLVSRRRVLRGVGVAGAAIGLGSVGGAPARADVRPGPWTSFGRRVEAAFRRMNLVGAAVAVVSSKRLLHAQPLGSREQGRRWAPVNRRTHFLVASTTKSMSSLLAATYIDQGRFRWDDPVREVWPGFRAPTPELTETLRVRDLFGMASGIDEPPALSALHEGDPVAEQVLQSLVNLPVAAAPNERWIYNNTVYAVGGYVPLLNAGISADRLAGSYTQQMRERVFEPTAMTEARITDDPRGVVADYARGNGLDLGGAAVPLNYGPVGSYAPVGGALANLNDMASYVQLQLRRGVSRTGRRVVSEENLAECWKPHIPVPTSAVLDPDVVSSGYAMGWIRNEFSDGTALVWHNGAIDGFTAYIGFLPEHDLGLVVLNAMNPGPTGTFFYTYVLNLLLNERLGLNAGVPAKVDELYQDALTDLRALGSRTRPVDEAAVEPYLGTYEGGYRLIRRGRELRLHQGSREMPIRALRDGGYVMSGGLLVGLPVTLRRDVDQTPVVELQGLEAVRRTVGL